MVSKNDVIQVVEGVGNGSWTGCLMIVDEVKDWGVLAYLHVPMQGDAYLRLKHGDYEIIGKAIMVHPDDDE